ncbi:secretion protein E [Latilactobacillus sakei]|uniref:Type II secretion system protein E n=1 Tax=Latilactobacillus sakei TaxID=1599 RepID=A0A9N7J1S1_LATSK|nr:competence type IV pilus ATPase ComGA [Latilactobacillus sakei]AWZ41806.1 competence protein ComGA [Latilactobacillus sakei]AWZ44516.1 competence protein ComGA [Latilactobacillus sakei]AWZ47026.1 competence protein ComGA [Latilactobacillus sakei]AYG16993.1 competence protein ComGA [Latilactobacillus sakei]AYG25714.1 competence protein ComGA [Latilactobacillus sakei]
MSTEEKLTTLLKHCAKHHVQDLYFTPTIGGWRLTERRQSDLVTNQELDKPTGTRYLNRLKYMAGMDISETRRAQTGRSELQLADQTIYLRLATVGDFLNRESLVIRFIYPIGAIYHCDDQQILAQLTQMSRQAGLILFAGPTGSGKTTSLYHLAQQSMSAKMVVAIEDPIEIVAPEFLQLQVNDNAGLSYAELLKISLRLRPDTLIIGEIRDLETAQYAVSAALSGHLVLSTIHARSTRGVVARLLDLGISNLQLRACLTGIAYQSLVTKDDIVQAHYELLTGSDYFSAKEGGCDV